MADSSETGTARTAMFTVVMVISLGSFGVGIKLFLQGIDIHHYGQGYASVGNTFLDCTWGISSLLLFLTILIIPAYVLSCHAQRVSFLLMLVWQTFAGIAVIVIFIMCIVLQFAGRNRYSCGYAPDGKNYSSNADCIRQCNPHSIAACCCCKTDLFSGGDAKDYVYNTNDVGCSDFRAAKRIEDDVKELCWYALLLLFIAASLALGLTYCAMCPCCKLWDTDKIGRSYRKRQTTTELTVTRLPVAHVVCQDDQIDNIATTIGSEPPTNALHETHWAAPEVAS